MNLETRARNFEREYRALCERHSAVLVTTPEEPRIVFVPLKVLRKYQEWWDEELTIIMAEGFKDFL